MKYYKNLVKHVIDLNLFGVGQVHIPADAACIELDENVADAINKSVFPNVVLEEVKPNISVDNMPIVKAKEVEEVDVFSNGEAVEQEVTHLMDMYTKRELQSKCDEKGIKYSSIDSKTVLWGYLQEA